MTSLNEITERIAYALNKPLSFALQENIKVSVKYWRALLIRRDINANGLSDELLQKIYVDLVKVDKADACTFQDGCEVLRTKLPIPKPLRLKNDVVFKFVGNIGGKPFTYTEYEEIPYTCYNKYTSKVLRYAYINSYIYVFNNLRLKKLAIQTIFADPSEVNTVCDDCYSDDKPYPIGEDMIQAIVQGILTGEFRLKPTDQEVSIEQEEK